MLLLLMQQQFLDFIFWIYIYSIQSTRRWLPVDPNSVCSTIYFTYAMYQPLPDQTKYPSYTTDYWL